jgi:glutamyl-tRNA synthetase
MVEKEVIKSYALKNAVEHKGKAVQGSVLSSLFAEGLEKNKVKEVIPTIQEVLKDVNSLSIEEQKKQYEEIKDSLKKRNVRAEGELPPLPNAQEGKVVMRIAPYPSGPLHIGNTRQVILNDEYCKKYKGRFILVMDDTIGNEIKPIQPEAYKLIEEGIKWLGCNLDKKTIYKSDRIETYYAYAEEMIKKGYMYSCSCSQEDFQKLKTERRDCPCRNKTPEEHLKNWKKMFDKNTPQGSLVIRLKTSMQDPDPAFRDRVMFKISERKHARIGNKYRVYPSMEFSWGIDDHLLGTTHVLRGIEHQMSTRVQDYIRKIFNWKNPESIYTGHLILEGIKISKSKGAKEVTSGEYSGWNDPRLWSLQSLKNRGIKPEAIREFIKNMGATKANSTVPVNVLYTLNKKHLSNTPHFFFVENPEKITISGTPIIEVKIPLNPKDKEHFRKYKTKQEFLIPKEESLLLQNKEYRLMNLLNFKSMQTSPIDKRHFSFVGEKSDDKVRTLIWLPANEKNIKTKIRMLDGILREGLAEEYVHKIKEGEVVFFEGLGFCNLVKKSHNELEFFFGHN